MSADAEFKVEAGAEDAVREQDKYLPIANISRIMKKALPYNAKIAKDAKEIVQEFVSEFISFVTSEASDKCQREKRKTINGDDLLWAMTTLGFEDSIDVLRIYLGKYREAEVDKTSKPSADRTPASASASLVPGQGGNTMPGLPPGYMNSMQYPQGYPNS